MKRLFVTLDLEGDYDGVITERKSFDALDCADAFIRLLREKGIRLTTFVTGEILDMRMPIVKKLCEAGSEFGAHSYSHRVSYDGDEIDEIVRGTRAFKNYFGVQPKGYRAPMGVISERGQEMLARLEYSYDASIFPTFVPGLFNHLKKPMAPYRAANKMILEIPFSVLPYVRIPLSISYWNFLGLRLLEWAVSRLELPDDLVLGLHMHDLCFTGAFKRLPWGRKIRHARTVLRKAPFRCLETFLDTFLSRGYCSHYLSELLNEASRDAMTR